MNEQNPHDQIRQSIDRGFPDVIIRGTGTFTPPPERDQARPEEATTEPVTETNCPPGNQ